MKKKKSKVIRITSPAFLLNAIRSTAFKRAKEKDKERHQYLDIVSAQLMCALTLEAVLNNLGKELFADWEEIERCLTPKQKLKRIAIHSGLEIDLQSPPFQYFQTIFMFRDSLVHAKSRELSGETKKRDEHGVPEILMDWEKHCNITIAKEWQESVENMSEKLSEAAKCSNPIHTGETTIWEEI